MNAIRRLVSRFSYCSLAISLLGACDASTQTRVDGVHDRLDAATASIEQRPWHVSVQLVGAEDSEICAGSIITRRWVLTAAHCIGDESDELRIVAGVTNLGEADGQARAVDEIVIHPHFKNPRAGGDLAMLHLAEPLELSAEEGSRASTIEPITQAMLDALMPGTIVEATGWSTELVAAQPWAGTSGDEEPAPFMPTGSGSGSGSGSGTGAGSGTSGPEPEIYGKAILSTTLELVASEEIRDDYEVPLGEDQLAARPAASGSGEPLPSACGGYDGGSLAIEVGGEWRLVGVDSFDVGCQLDDESQPPRAYTQPTNFVDWIHDVISRDQPPTSAVDSCEGRCGLRVPSGCRCDALCIDDGSCCADFVDHC